MNVSEIKIPVPWGHIAADANEETYLNTQSEEAKLIQKETEEKDLSQEPDRMNNLAVKNNVEDSGSKQSILDAQSLLTKLGLKSITLTKSVPQGGHSPPLSTKKFKKLTETKSNRTNPPLPPDSTVIQKQKVKSPVRTNKNNNEDKVSKPKKEVRKLDKTESVQIKKMSKTPSQQEKKRQAKTSPRKTMPPSIPGLMKRTDSEESSDFMKTYNIVKIKNPQLLASRTAKLNLIKQTLLNIESEKNAKSSGKDKIEKRCDDCGTPLSSGRDFIMHRDKCEVRQKKLEKILSGLNLPKSLQNTPQKEEYQSSPNKTNVSDRIVTNLTDRLEASDKVSNLTDRPEANDKVSSPVDTEDDAQSCEEPLYTETDIQEESRTENVSNTSSQKTPNKTNKSPFRSLYNLYDGLNKEHINIILKASRNERTLRSRSQETDDQIDKESDKCKHNESETSQSEIIITTRITGNVIERNTMIRPVQNDTEPVPVPSNSNEPDSTVDEGQANSRTLYEALKNSCQNVLVKTESDLNEQDATAPPQPQRELISDCPQGLPRSANIRKLLKRNVLNPIRRKGSILSDKLMRMDRKSFTLEKSKIKALKKNEKLASLLNNLIESPNMKKSIISKKRKFLQECQKDLKTSWQIEETEKRNEEERNARAMRASNRRTRKMEDKPEGEQQNESNEQETVETNQAEHVTLPTDEEEEEQVVPTANLFIPYNFVSAGTPSKDIAPILEKTPTETPIEITSQPNVTDIDPITVSPQADTFNVDSSLRDQPSTETNSQQPHTTTTPGNVFLSSRKTKSPAVKTPKTPYTPKSKEQLMLKQEIMEELRKLESRKWCKVCKKPFANNSTLNLHYSSVAHKKLVEKSLFGGNVDKEIKEKVRGRKKSPTATPTKKTMNITPETSDGEMEESLWEEEQVKLLEEEDTDEEEPVEKKAKRGKPRQTLSVTSENEPSAQQQQPVRRSRRSSTLDKTDSKENTNEENKETTYTSPTQTPNSKSKDKNLCTTCNVSFLSELQLNKHYASKMHKTASFIVADGKPKVCSVCKVSFTTNNQLHRHYTTQLHKTAAAKLVTELEGRGVIKTALFP
uniref:C2H2-type domain-containing protein n=1 Tax=Cacopsylla melanoneura TaxID=428564 RepID=A0A8D9F6T2_9HEMI